MTTSTDELKTMINYVVGWYADTQAVILVVIQDEFLNALRKLASCNCPCLYSWRC